MLPSRENNPFFPLPRDYRSLTIEGRRKARIALLQSWYTPGSRNFIGDPEAFVYAFRFYKEYYRKGWEGNTPKYRNKSPELHDEWINLVSRNQFLIISSFRGSGKTMVFGEELPEFFIISRPHTAVQYTSAADDLTIKQIRAVRLELEQNELVLDDFGELRGRRPYVWASDLLELSNGSSFKGVSSESRQRGTTQLSLRPIVGILDDPEVDTRVRNPDLRSSFEDWLFNVYFPCFEPTAIRIWANTLLYNRAWGYRAAHKEDPRFAHWTSKIYTCFKENEEGTVESQWDDRFPMDDLRAMAGDGSKSVIGFGRSAFSAEYLNKPTSKADSSFEWSDERHTYYWKQDNGLNILHDPYRQLDIPLNDFQERSTAVVGVDLALGFSHSDYSAIVVAALDESGILWVLETWQGRVPPVETLEHALTLSEYWKAPVIAVERIAFEQVAIDQLQEQIDKRHKENMWAPEINPIKVSGRGSETKQIRALCLQFRFRDNLIKVPIECSIPGKLGFGAPELIEQIQGFTESGGGLKYDDMLDALVSCQITFQRFGGVGSQSILGKEDPIDKFLEDSRQIGISSWLGTDLADPSKLARARLRKSRMDPTPADSEEFSFITAVDDELDSNIWGWTDE